jgi:PAS domain S-box-containing protein
VDVTDLKEAEQRIEKSKRELEKRVEERTAELTRANEALQTEVRERQRAEAHFQRLFRLGPVAGIITALDTGEILNVNDRCLEMVGYERDEVVGRTMLELGLVSSEQRDTERAELTETGQSRDREIQLIAKDGSVIDVLVSSEVIDREATPSVLTSGIDITARKETEAMLRAAKEEAETMNRLKTSFMANMSHEIRTPLTGIIGFADVLSETLSEENQEFVSFIQTSGERLLETLNSVLDLARLEAQEIQPQRSPVDLAALAKETASLFELQATKKGLTFRVDVPEAPQWAELDEGCMKRVLNNLLSNAIKFTEDGRVTLHLSVDTGQPLPVYFHVEDTGIGMSASFQNELFSDFTQESLGNKRTHEGAGLGLAITKRLVDLMEGTIEVESTKGSGTTFTVRLPLRPVDLVEATVPEVDDRAPIPSWAEDEAPPRVLVIDDRPEVGLIVERFLSDCTVTAVEDPSTVQRILEEDPAFDVAFVDIQLGVNVSGEEVLAMIRSMPALEMLPVVALTAHSLPRDKQRFMDQGFNGYIGKPFSRRQLRTVLQRMIESGPSARIASGASDADATGAPPTSVD